LFNIFKICSSFSTCTLTSEENEEASYTDRPFVRKGGWVPVVKVAVPAFGMVALTEAIGLYPAAAIYLAVYMRWIGRHRWITIFLVSILLPVASYFLFDKWFLIPMPKGYWTVISGLY
jgi:hypothetical protein